MRGRLHVLLAPAEELELGVAVEQVALVVAAGEELVGDPRASSWRAGGALGHGLGHLLGHEGKGAEGVEVAELVAGSR